MTNLKTFQMAKTFYFLISRYEQCLFRLSVNVENVVIESNLWKFYGYYAIRIVRDCIPIELQ